ncbi:MAG: hypothetical protein Q4A18_00375 [Rikenellaceae bacterium]|nr:hypothetical protein [Rikenellaceae bacterium]
MIPEYREIESREAWEELLALGGTLRHYAFQAIRFDDRAAACRFTDCLFFGCRIPESMRDVMEEDCFVFPAIPRPFKVFPPALYDADSLYSGYDPTDERTFEDCYDTRVYRHYIESGKQATCVSETLSRTLHDHAISRSLHELLAAYDERQVVAIMGGHALSRTDYMFLKVARISKHLAEAGCLMMSGGGPGAMEATHLGAWFAGRSDEELMMAVDELSVAPSFRDEGWLASAFKVRRRYPRLTEVESVGIPTWFYGHEPATPFATHIAKYFDNSIREDGLLALAKGGVIFSPGSAGTMQEIFQDAAQNHYKTFGFASPMVFLDSEYWTRQIPAYPLLDTMMERGRYKNLQLSLTDDESFVIDTILNFIAQK